MIKCRQMLVVFAALLIGSACFVGSAFAGEAEVGAYVSLEHLRSSGDDWVVASDDVTAEAGHIRLRHDKWLMCFLHWRPLDSTNRDLSIAYVEKHLLSFWGPSMPFSLTGDTGRTVVAGHPAYYVGGTIGEGAIQTRFIVWNCEETGRQFTADCNINRRMGTVESQLEIQYEITASICCHKGCVSEENAELPNTYSSSDWMLSFDAPSSWRTHSYESSAWYPDGVDENSGSLWTLLTNSEKLIELHWAKHDGSLSSDRLTGKLDALLIDSVVAKESPGISGYTIDSVYEADGRFWAEGKLVWLQNYDGQVLPDECSFVAALWTKDDLDYLMLAGLTHMADVWGVKLDLSPTRETMHRFLLDEVLPGVGVY